jgi:hypothetical protein
MINPKSLLKHDKNTTYRRVRASSDLNKTVRGNTFWFLLDLVAGVT